MTLVFDVDFLSYGIRGLTVLLVAFELCLLPLDYFLIKYDMRTKLCAKILPSLFSSVLIFLSKLVPYNKI